MSNLDGSPLTITPEDEQNWAEIKKLKEEVSRLNAKWQDYETNYVLPVFKWHEEVFGSTMNVRDHNPKNLNCVQLFFDRLREKLAAAEEHAKVCQTANELNFKKFADYVERSKASLKQFVLFAGSHYYPSGGWEDFRGDFATVDEAKAASSVPWDGYLMGVCDWYQIVDIRKGECVYARTRKYGSGEGWFDPSGHTSDEEVNNDHSEG